MPGAANANNNIAEGKISAVCRGNFNGNDFAVFKAHPFCILRSCVNVAHSRDNALFNLYLAAGADKLACAGACNIAAFPNGSGYAD